MLDVFILSNAVGPCGETFLASIPPRQKQTLFSLFCPHDTKALRDIDVDACNVRRALLHYWALIKLTDTSKDSCWRLWRDVALDNSLSFYGLASNKCCCSKIDLEALPVPFYPLVLFVFWHVAKSFFPMNTRNMFLYKNSHWKVQLFPHSY